MRLYLFESTAPGYLTAIESNLWIFTLFGFGYRYLNRPSGALSYLSQAAYPVYIIHMFVMYAGASFILPMDISVITKLIIMVLFTISVCYLIYEIFIRRIGILRPLFGVKWKAGKSIHAAVKTDPLPESLSSKTQRL
jgi:membrane-bound acyltransferase YfiQ involved in biofilm formation